MTTPLCVQVECIVPGPSPLSPCFGADEDVERVFSRMRKAKLSQLAAEPAAMPRRLSLEPVDDILKMQDEDSGACSALRRLCFRLVCCRR